MVDPAVTTIGEVKVSDCVGGVPEFRLQIVRAVQEPIVEVVVLAKIEFTTSSVILIFV